MPAVSVIIPTFNRADPLERAVRSALTQTHTVHEVLVCDDGCTDDSAARMAAIGDARVKWVEGPVRIGPHAGRPAVPRNRGIAAATGEWLAFLDDDDAWLPDKTAVQMEAVRRHGTDATCCNAERIVPDQGSQGAYFSAPDAIYGLRELLPVNRVICSSAIVKRDVVLRAGGFPEAPELRALEDYALWLRIATLTSFAYVARPLVQYTDAPSGSVRAVSAPVDVQRDTVLSDLWAWGRNGILTKEHRRLVARHLRSARRKAGRPLADRLFIR